MTRRALRTLLLGAAAALGIIAVPAPAFASTGTSPLRLPLPVTIEFPTELPALPALPALPVLPLSLGPAPRTETHRGSTHVAIRLLSDVPARRVAAQGPGRVAVTAPGLISVVPVGPLPSVLRPRVARESVRAAARTGATTATSLPAPPVGFWFALVLLVLVFGSASYLIGDRRRYRLAVSITNR